MKVIQRITTSILATLFLLTLPAAVEAQFTFTTNNGALTVSGYAVISNFVVIPDTAYGMPVTAIGDSAFDNKSFIISVTIPNSITNIGNFAFNNCANMFGGVTIPDSVISIGYYAFAGCRIASLTLGNSVTDIGAVAFAGGYMTNLAIPDSVTSIGQEAFGGCARLTSLTLGNSITDIGDDAFRYCDRLTNVYVPASVTGIGHAAFGYCPRLTAITVATNNLAFASVGGILFNKPQTTLYQCPGSKTGNYDISNTVTNIGADAFALCSNLTSVTIPNSVTRIENSTFSQCATLTNIAIPNSVTNIGNGAFSQCFSLPSITIPNSVTKIDNFAFSECFSLTNVTLPNRVANIGFYTFRSCKSLKAITIPNSVTNISDAAFSFCTSLTSVCFQGNAPSVGSSPFSGDNNVIIYYMPGTAGWGAMFGGRPTALWKPLMQTSDGSLGVRTNRFGFNISWASGMTVAVDACTNPGNPVWFPLQTNTLTSDTLYFSDSQWTNYPNRFYRLRWP